MLLVFVSIFNYDHARGSFNRRGEIGGFDVVLLLALQFFSFSCPGKWQYGYFWSPFIHTGAPHILWQWWTERLCPQQIVKAWIPRHRFSGSSIELTRPACYSAPKVNSSPAIWALWSPLPVPARLCLFFSFVKETLSAGLFFCTQTGVWVSLCCRFYEVPLVSIVHFKRIIIRHKTDKITFYKIFSLFLVCVPWGDSLLQLSGNLGEIKFYRERILISFAFVCRH